MALKGVRGIASTSMTAICAASLSFGCGQSTHHGGSGPGTPGGGAGGSGNTSGSAGAPSGAGRSASGGVTGSGGAVSTAGGAGVVGSGGSGASGGVAGSGGGSGAPAQGGATTAQGGSGAGGSAGGGIAGGTAPSGGQSATGGAGGATACAPPTVTLSGANAVAGSLITFNDNGGWCWYQDERALVDTKANKLLIGSVASGGARNGDIEATVYDLSAKTKKLYTISKSLESFIDDHNAPAFVIRPDGHYLAMYSGHRVDCISRTSIFDGTSWSAEKQFDWGPLGCPWAPPDAGMTTNMVTYSNPWYLGSSIFSAVRSVDTDPAVLTSADDGESFSYEGRLASSPQQGYVAGYFKYWGNNIDRLDFIGTEAHPRNADNNLWHGYVQGGIVYDSFGTLVDGSLKDMSSTVTNAKDISAFTPVFKTRTTIHGVEMSHAWDIDLVRYADGTLGVLWQARANYTGNDKDSTGEHPDVRLLYARFDGTEWKLTYLVKAGPQLYSSEEDYVGLGALDPDDPTTIYISTPYDPTTDTLPSTTAKREIWRGTTCDNGATFQWTPVTANSTRDNIRPIVPKWDAAHTALLWLQGTYNSAQAYALSVVGLVSGQ